MANPVWGLLLKSLISNETIEQAIARLITAHNDDEEAHTGAGQSLQSHKASEIIDHLALSIIEDKIADGSITSGKITTDQIVGKDIRTAEDVGDEVDGVSMLPTGIEMWQNGDKKVDIPVSGNPVFKGDISVNQLFYLRDAVLINWQSLDGFETFNEEATEGQVEANIGRLFMAPGPSASYTRGITSSGNGMILDWTKKIDCQWQIVSKVGSAYGSIYFVVGSGILSFYDDVFEYAGFRILNDELRCVVGKLVGGVTTEYYDAIPEIDITESHRYAVKWDPGVSIKYYIDDVLVSTRTTNLPTATEESTPVLNFGVKSRNASENFGVKFGSVFFAQDL